MSCWHYVSSRLTKTKEGDYFFLSKQPHAQKFASWCTPLIGWTHLVTIPDCLTSLKTIHMEFALWSSYLCLAVCHSSFMALFESSIPQWESSVFEFLAMHYSFVLCSTECCMGLSNSQVCTVGFSTQILRSCMTDLLYFLIHPLAQCWAHTRYSNLPQWFIHSMMPSLP